MAGLKDIALATGVSVRTVSRAIKDNGYVSASVRERILAVAEELCYRPNRLARSLKTNKSCEIMALAWSMDELHAQKIYGMEEALRTQGFWLSLLAASSRSGTRPAGAALATPDETEEICGEIFDRSPAGVVAIGAAAVWQYHLLERIMKRGIPCLILDTPFADASRSIAPAPGVYVNRQQGVYEAVCYLASTGRKDVLYAGLQDTPEGVNETRLGGYRRAIIELGLAERIAYFDASADRYSLDGDIASGQFTAGRRAAAVILQMSQRPQAVQAFTDLMALGLLDGLHRAGLRIPQDIAIVGFDNRSAAAFASPPLTTVALPGHEVGVAAAQMLAELVAGRPQSDRILPASLIVRESA